MKSGHFLHNMGILSAKWILTVAEVLAKMEVGCFFSHDGAAKEGLGG